MHSHSTVMRRLSDSQCPTSFGNKLRTKRFRQFETLAALLPRPLKILDVGGTASFWENRGWAGRSDIQVVTLNLKAEEQRYENVKPIAGDAIDIKFDDRVFDIAFSNSVIEHLF